MGKQLYEKQALDYKPISPTISLEDIINDSSGKNIIQLLNNYNHLYVEYSESKINTRNKVPVIFRRKGLWITYIIGNEKITEYYIGKNTDIQNTVEWPLDANWHIVNAFNKIGDSENRPILNEDLKGFQYFDTDLNKPIWWTGDK